MRFGVRSAVRSKGGRLIPLAAMALLWLAPSATLAGNPPASRDGTTELVRRLGAPNFAERERATRELKALGIIAKDALTSAVNDRDAELRTRARAILAEVTEADFRIRLEAFSADFDGSRRQSLPGWQRFGELFGTGQRARQLFVEMAREEPELLAAYAEGGKVAGDALNARCRALSDQFLHTANSESLFPVGTLATLLLVGADKDVAVDEQLCLQLYTGMIYQPEFAKNTRSGPRSVMMRKLLGMWIVKDVGTTGTLQNLVFAASYDLQDEGLTLAKRVLSDGPANVQLRQFALLALGRFGSKEQLPMVEKYLSDSTTCGTIQLGSPPRQVDVQMRDVALAVSIHLTAQEPAAYGAASVQSSPQSFFQVPTLAFLKDSQRDTALRLWAEWRAAHPEP